MMIMHSKYSAMGWEKFRPKLQKIKKNGENLCVLVALLSQDTIFYNAVNSDRCLVTLTKNILLLEHQSLHYALCSVRAATQAIVFFNIIQETFGNSIIVHLFP
jgi:hypothetical protein